MRTLLAAPDATAAAACSTVADAPPPPNGVRDAHRSLGMPTLRMSASSSLASAVNVTVPSMSVGWRPASSMAARAASEASWSSDRPEFLENSVWPMPTIAALLFNTARSGPSVTLRSGGRLSLAGRRRPLASISPPTGGHPALRHSCGRELGELHHPAVERVEVFEGDLHGHVVLD